MVSGWGTVIRVEALSALSKGGRGGGAVPGRDFEKNVS